MLARITRRCARAFITLALLALFAAPGSAQAVLLDLEAGAPASDRMRIDSSGAFVAYGFVRDVGNTTGCAAQIPASGAGTRFMWHPCRGAVRFGRAPIGPGATSWDDASMDDFTFAGGNQVIASDYGAFAYGDQVTVSSTVGVGFGSGVTVTGTAGFSAGASNVCSGFACTAIGYTVRAAGQGSIALGYRTTATGDYTTAIGYRGSTNGFDGAMVFSAEDGTSTDSVRAQAAREFRLRAAGGIRLRVSSAANSNTPGTSSNVGCDLTASVPSWTCASSRTIKENFMPVDVEDVLERAVRVPVSTWTMIGADPSIVHMGPVAEDFNAEFPLGLGPTTIGLGDFDGVNLAAIQALEARTRALRDDVERLRGENADLRAELASERAARESLDARLRRVEQAMEPAARPAE